MTKKTIFEEVKGYLFMIIGCFAYAFSTVLFLADNGIVAGGITGLATLLYNLWKWDIGLFTILLNIPIFLLGIKYTGWKFILR